MAVDSTGPTVAPPTPASATSSNGHRPSTSGLGGLPSTPLIVIGLAFAGLYGGVLAYSMTWHDADVWVAWAVVPVLVVITLPVLLRIGRDQGDSLLALILVSALLAKFLATVVRWHVSAEVYGSFDASGYLDYGDRLYGLYRQGRFATEDLDRALIGTGFVRGLTGVVMAVVGPSWFGTYMVFAWMGFLGMLAFLGAFITALPDGLVRRYALLVMFLPSLMYWPASVGKDAWMMLTLGIGALGAARLLRRRLDGYLLFALGAGGASMVRPHMALLLVVATTIGFALRRPTPRRRPFFGPAGKIIGIVLLATGSIVMLMEAEDYFGIDGDQRGTDSAEAVFDETERRTTTGGAEFEADRVRSPADVPAAAVTVLMRPFPWEAHNLQARLTGFEGLLLIGLLGVSWRRLASIPKLVWRSSWVALALSYTLMFIVAFSSFGNFGIIARQRVQVLPFFLALLCLPIAIKTAQRRDAANWTRPDTDPDSDPDREVAIR